MRILLAIAAIIFYSGSSNAASDSYICTIAEIHHLNKKGNLDVGKYDLIVGKEFTVDRQTGKVIGKYISNDGFDTKVLDSGNNQQSFKTVSSSKLGFMHVLYLEIQEFDVGVQKPFVLMDSSLIYSGLCQ